MASYPSIGAMLDARRNHPPQAAPGRRRNRQTAVTAPQPVLKEEPVSSRITEAQQAIDHAVKTLAAAAHASASLAANELAMRIDREGIGLLLKPEEIDAAIVLLRGLEDGRGAQPQQPQMRP